jgi:hypothetical protein
MTHRAALAVILALAAPAVAQGQQGAAFGAAPAGDPAAVALRIIHANFDRAVCPRVTRAERLQDRSIRATCSNGETFRAFAIDGRPVALRCSAARQRGIEGC